MLFRALDFANLQESRNEFLLTPTIRLYGYDWRLKLYPKGDASSSEKTEYMSCYLECVPRGNNAEEPFAKFSFLCTKQKHIEHIEDIKDFSLGRGWTNYLTQKDILEKYLDEYGTLVISVDLQFAVKKRMRMSGIRNHYKKNRLWYNFIIIQSQLLMLALMLMELYFMLI